MAQDTYKWTDNPTVSGVSVCDTDVLNECLMHLKYDKKDGGGFNLFDIKISDHILTGEESVGWLLQGSLVTMTYPDAVNKIKEEYNNGVDETDSLGITFRKSLTGRKIADISQSEAIDQVFVTKGYGDYYILDSLNNQFYLPRTKCFHQFTLDTSLVNQFNEAGLPNIEGTLELSRAYISPGNTGLFKLDTSSSGIATSANTGGSNNLKASFNASRANPIYGASNTVQPPSSNKLLYYKVGETIINETTIDISNVLNEIATLSSQKADINFSNVNVPFITDSYRNGQSWYRIWSDGWIEQGGYIGSNSSGTLEFLYPFTTTDYSVLSGIKNLNPNQPHSVYWNNYTLTSVGYSTRVQSGQGAAAGSTCSVWYAFGY